MTTDRVAEVVGAYKRKHGVWPIWDEVADLLGGD